MKQITLLGATGSIGTQTLDIVRDHADVLRIVGLSTHQNIDLLASQIEEFAPEFFVIADSEASEEFLRHYPQYKSGFAGHGKEALKALAAQSVDVVVNGLLGYAGLEPTLAALAAGNDVALANKETMVTAGELVCSTARKHEARIIPVDSEHSAIDQCLAGSKTASDVRRLVLTASGGPFRTWDRQAMDNIGLQQALRHPTWNMGAKITIDSATLMNKGLEIIEARWLFDVDFDRIDVLVHPQSIIHSMVEFVDGSVLAQLGTTDMRLPIWYALHSSSRVPVDFGALDLASIGTLTFENLDAARFPCVELAIQAGRQGGTAPAVLNAANEVAVEAFLKEKIGYLDIARVINATLEIVPSESATPDLESIRGADRQARERARDFVMQKTSPRRHFATGESSC